MPVPLIVGLSGLPLQVGAGRKTVLSPPTAASLVVDTMPLNQ